MSPTLQTFLPAWLLALVFLSGDRWSRGMSPELRRSAVSLGAGVSLAYVFLHVFPALETMRTWFVEETSGIAHPFYGSGIYLWSMLGFLLFYGVSRSVHRAHLGSIDATGGGWPRHVYIGSFVAYVWLVSYFLLHGTQRGPVGLALYTLAMVLHFYALNHTLRHALAPGYDRGPARLLGAASLAGWVCGVLFDIPRLPLIALVALVAGAILSNTMVTELGEEDAGRLGPFAGGAVLYAVMLLLAH